MKYAIIVAILTLLAGSCGPFEPGGRGTIVQYTVTSSDTALVHTEAIVKGEKETGFFRGGQFILRWAGLPGDRYLISAQADSGTTISVSVAFDEVRKKTVTKTDGTVATIEGRLD